MRVCCSGTWLDCINYFRYIDQYICLFPLKYVKKNLQNK